MEVTLIKDSYAALLAKHGFYLGPRSDTNDHKAVRAFQRAFWGDGTQLLTVDGIIGRNTNTAMGWLPNLSRWFLTFELWDERAHENLIKRELVGALEALRRRIGRPLVINSGYRSLSTNTLVGGAPHSLHMHGLAADLGTVVGAADVRSIGAFSGMGFKGKRVLHVDMRHVLGDDNPTPTATPKAPAQWSY